LVETSSNHYDFYEKLPEEAVVEVTVKKADSNTDFSF
jgi:hypothetical protein